MHRLYEVLRFCNKEEEIKATFISFFRMKLNAMGRIDHYTPQVLYEFKFDKSLNNIAVMSSIIAQTLYYIRDLKNGNGLYANAPIPPFVCIVDKNEAFYFSTSEYKNLYSVKTESSFDWDRAASVPCPLLVKAVLEHKQTQNIKVYNLSNNIEETLFIEELNRIKISQLNLFEIDKKTIDENNFLDVFKYWENLFGKYVQNGKKPSEYFVADIENGKSYKIEQEVKRVAFQLDDTNARIKDIPMQDYEYFWSLYQKVSKNTVKSIRQKIDRISEDYMRRFTGEFYTPIEFAEKGLKYIEKSIGKWWENDNYRLWDMAAGTGNLEFALPSEALEKCYISTLLEDDANYCSRIFPQATCFQYDYLNDDVDYLINKGQLNFQVQCKMPKKLFEDLQNPKIKWIIFINPPFVTSNDTNKLLGKKSKDEVSITKIRSYMTNDNLGETSRELYSQFLYRISKEFNGKKAYLAMFSKLKYINSNNDQKLRDTFFKYEFKKGFMFHSKLFHGNKGNFPVGFLVWDLFKNKALKEQDIILDVFNDMIEKYGTKKIVNDNRNLFLSKWLKREANSHIMPPLKSSINLSDRVKDVRDGVSDGFLCSLMCCGNDFQHQNQTALLSSSQGSAGSTSVTKNNFEKAMIVHTVRRLPVATWTNDRDQFYQPIMENLEAEFIGDCVIWSVFSNSNETVSLKNIQYKGNNYRIKNNLYPYLLKEVKHWECNLTSIKTELDVEKEERFLAEWIQNHKLSLEAEKVLNAGKELYKKFYISILETHWQDYCIENWDVGYWQVRNAVTEKGKECIELDKLKTLHLELGKKLLPKLYDLKFIPEDVINFK